MVAMSVLVAGSHAVIVLVVMHAHDHVDYGQS